MKKIRILNKEYNVSNVIYDYIKSLLIKIEFYEKEIKRDDI